MTILAGLPGGTPLPNRREHSGLHGAATFRTDDPSPGKLVAGSLPENLLANERGLVMVPTMVPDGMGRVHVSGGIRSAFLKPALLFYDRIINPLSDLTEFGYSPEESFLDSCGVLQRSDMQKREGLRESEWLYAPEIFFAALDKREPGAWSLFAEKDVRPVASRVVEDGRGLLVELHRAIAVPSGDTPLEDLLNFKEKRRDELHALRSRLADIYQNILAAPDRHLGRLTAFDNLQSAVADELKVIKEARIKSYLCSIKSSLSVGNVSTALTTFGTSVAAGLPLLTAVGAGAGVMTVGVGIGLRDRKKRDGPFAYVGSYHRDLRWS